MSKLNQQLELSRWTYNKTLELRKNYYETENKSLSLYDTSEFLTKWKLNKTELNNVYSQVLQNVQRRVDFAFKSFFRRVKNKENPGFPRFKGYGRYDSITYPQTGFRIHENSTYFSKTGRVKTVFHRPVEGIVKTCTIQKTSTDKWYVCFSCEVEKPAPLTKTGNTIGIDLGLKTFIYASDESTVKNPRFFKESQVKLAKAQRKLSKAKKGTKKRKKHKKIVAGVHEKIKNKRNDFCHKIALNLVRKYDIISHEDLNIKSMVEQKKFSKSISDVSWGQLISILSYKAEEAGKMVIAINPKNTTQQCSGCKSIVPKTLKDRVHSCPKCGLTIDRDLNASINIHRLGLESIEPMALRNPRL